MFKFTSELDTEIWNQLLIFQLFVLTELSLLRQRILGYALF
jgi:hypothetical protein